MSTISTLYHIKVQMLTKLFYNLFCIIKAKINTFKKNNRKKWLTLEIFFSTAYVVQHVSGNLRSDCAEMQAAVFNLILHNFYVPLSISALNFAFLCWFFKEWEWLPFVYFHCNLWFLLMNVTNYWQISTQRWWNIFSFADLKE